MTRAAYLKQKSFQKSSWMHICIDLVPVKFLALKSDQILLICVQVNEFVKLGGHQLVPYYADILGAILPAISDKEEKIRLVSQSGSFRSMV